MTAAALLDRLERVRTTGPGRWIAACPAHEDRSPSLSIREVDGEKILLHCFAGCDVEAVLHALGLRMSDLFPEPLAHHVAPSRSRIPAADLLAIIDRHAMLVTIIAADVLEHREIDEPTWRRLAQAASRIGRARDMATPARVRR
ncbi:hypothetical protein BH24PSE2_BH24PSE2_17520 [soil metagenome]